MSEIEALSAAATTHIVDWSDTDRVYDSMWEMARMQSHLNSVVHPEWRTQGHEYYRAIWMECAELLDHYGWKWWKDSRRDLDQVKIEIVDIWHFGLSDLIRDNLVVRAQASAFTTTMVVDEDMAFPDAIEALALVTLKDKRFHIWRFAGLMRSLPMTFDELHRLYVGKNVLNDFRQRHGYKDGTYRKLWYDGREDNAHLADVLSSEHVLTADAAKLPKLVRKKLGGLYARL